MAVPPHAMPPEQQQDEDDDDFTFPTPPPPQFVAGGRGGNKNRHHHLPCSPPSYWLHLSPIRRSFSAADCAAASPWRSRCSSPAALSDLCFDGEEEEEERMDSLWEDLNDDGDDLFSLDVVSRRRSVGGADAAAARARREAGKEALGASRSSRRRPPGLVTMMRALRKMFVAHKGKSRVHRDEQSTIASASASPSPSPLLVARAGCNKK